MDDEEEYARRHYCPYSMAAPSGPRHCAGSECLAWEVCPWRLGARHPDRSSRKHSGRSSIAFYPSS
jgi:hypothetical protein